MHHCLIGGWTCWNYPSHKRFSSGDSSCDFWEGQSYGPLLLSVGWVPLWLNPILEVSPSNRILGNKLLFVHLPKPKEGTDIRMRLDLARFGRNSNIEMLNQQKPSTFGVNHFEPKPFGHLPFITLQHPPTSLQDCAKQRPCGWHECPSAPGSRTRTWPAENARPSLSRDGDPASFLNRATELVA